MPNDINWAPIGMSLEEAARALRVNVRTVSEAIRDQGLPAKKIGVQWRISPRALEDWLNYDNSKSEQDSQE